MNILLKSLVVFLIALGSLPMIVIHPIVALSVFTVLAFAYWYALTEEER